MVRLILLGCFFLSLSFGSVYSQEEKVVLTVNGTDITEEEFLQVYLKNNKDPKFDKESMDDYIELFKNFKLKVTEAMELGYDTIPSVQRELEGYKKQLARPYLVDSAKNEEIVKEAYERYKQEVDASHILIMVDKNASAEDTLKAYNKILDIKKKADKGEDFGKLAQEHSEDQSAKQNKGRLGFFTAFQMVYPFESAAFSTNVGEVSSPIRTKYGYHILKVHDKREARGTITTAHIMVGANAGTSKDDLKNAETKINEIYQKLEEGEDFGKLAKLYSDDTGTKNRGGRLPAFGAGTSQRMVPEFEDAAFALSNDGEYSKPFKTDYGFHIVKRISYDPVGSYEELQKMLQNKVNKGERGEQTQKYFVAKLKDENKFRDRSKRRLKDITETLDSSVYNAKWEAKELKRDKWLFKYNGEKYHQSEFVNFIEDKQVRTSVKLPFDIYVNELYKKWQNEKIIEDEKSRLSEKYPAYRALMNEYRDGVLLYEIMKEKVWDKALKDTTGLKHFFEQNQNNYQWPERLHVHHYVTDKAEIAQKIHQTLSDSLVEPKEIAKIVNADSQLNVNASDKKVALDTDEFEALMLNSHDLGLREPKEVDGQYIIVNVIEKLDKMPKKLKETRGTVIQDYQNYLEDEWLKELKAKYEVVVNEGVLYNLGN